MIDFGEQLTGLDGKGLIEKVNGHEVELTLGQVAVNALLMMLPEEHALPAGDKVRRFVIATKAHEGQAELTAEEIAIVKACIGRAYGPLVVARAWQLLDPASVR